MNPVIKRALVVEDHETILEVLSLVLKRRGFEVLEVADGSAAIDLIEKYAFDVVIVDLVLRDLPGVEIITRLRAKDAEVCILAISGKGQQYLDEAMNAGANHALEKPFSIDEVMEAIK